MNYLNRILCLAASFSVSVSCSFEEPPLAEEPTPDLPATPYEYGVAANNHVATLGRVLFYDRKLSLNNTVSCSSCHKQGLAFADNEAFSVGFEGRRTIRNSMPIQNLAPTFFDSIIFDPGFPGFFQTVLFWDGRESELPQMVLKPIINHIEMGFSDLEELAAKLAKVPYYKDLFDKAYGDSHVTVDRIADALSQFLMAIKSENTKFDKSAGSEAFTPLENLGLELFFTTYDCNSCHQVQNTHGYLGGGVFANIGLDKEYSDGGVAAVSGDPADAGKFKIPSLRNVALTGPYMHDGRFSTLEEVIEHYSSGIQDHPNLDARLRTATGEPIAMEIPEADKVAIIAFLNTLTDYDMVTDTRFSNPFKSN